MHWPYRPSYAGDPGAFVFKLRYSPNDKYPPKFEAFPISERLSSYAVKNFGVTALGYSDDFTLTWNGELQFNVHTYPETGSRTIAKGYNGSPYFGGARGSPSSAARLIQSFEFPYMSGFALCKHVSVYELAVTPAGNTPSEAYVVDCYPAEFDCLAGGGDARGIAPVSRPQWNIANMRMFGRMEDAAWTTPAFFPDVVNDDRWGYWDREGGKKPWPTYEMARRAGQYEAVNGPQMVAGRIAWQPAWDEAVWRPYVTGWPGSQ
jgi:hypothetical protein